MVTFNLLASYPPRTVLFTALLDQVDMVVVV